MTRIWIIREQYIRRDRDGARYKRTHFCVEREGMKLIGNTLTFGLSDGVRLAHQPAAVLRHLMLDSGVCAHGELINTLYPDPDDECEYPENLLTQLISELRPHIKGHGWEIQNWARVGYILQHKTN